MNGTEHVFDLHNTTDIHNVTDNYSHTPSSSGLPQITTALPQMLGAFQPLVANGYLQNSLNFFFFGTLLETGRRLWQWIMDRFTGGFVLTAHFDSSDPAYEWFFAYLNDEKIWSTMREFKVTARASGRTWGVNTSADNNEGAAEYLPTYDQAQLFVFRGTWCQVMRVKAGNSHNDGHEDGGELVLTLYTRKREVLDDLVETAKARYTKKSKPRLVVHGTDHCGSWCQTTTKARRPMDSLILPDGVKEMLIGDAREFLRSEAWYAEAGIQHKRGYLLYGPPGTGKSSTIHALAGELDLEIYSLSLAANGLDDTTLTRLVSSTPAHSIILIEDIDCAFPSREELEKKKEAKDAGITLADTQSKITLSGLLNVIDGVSSEEGRLLFATTNYVHRLDPALLRAGRMDVKILYKMSTRDQIVNLFKRFYPASAPEPVLAITTPVEGEAVDAEKKKGRRISALDLTPPPTPKIEAEPTSTTTTTTTTTASGKFDIDTTPIYPPRLPAATIQDLAEKFADGIPPNKFTVAELQGYLLTVKTRPFEAVAGIEAWMKDMEEEKARILVDEEKKKKEEKADEEKKKKEAKAEEEKKAKEEKEAEDKTKKEETEGEKKKDDEVVADSSTKVEKGITTVD